MILDQETKIPFAIGCDIIFFLIKKIKRKTALFSIEYELLCSNIKRSINMLLHNY